jgi:hypothetical protein
MGIFTGIENSLLLPVNEGPEQAELWRNRTLSSELELGANGDIAIITLLLESQQIHENYD